MSGKQNFQTFDCDASRASHDNDKFGLTGVRSMTNDKILPIIPNIRYVV